jgi:glycosyltransferase involved in cell wall biosynthesis
MLCMNGGDRENWPRVGLEAMASGVPVVAERAWGWLEMIEDGVTGLLYDSPAEATEQLHRLATNEPLRLSIAEAARVAVERLADQDRIADRWSKLLWDVERGHETAGHLLHSA